MNNSKKIAIAYTAEIELDKLADTLARYGFVEVVRCKDCKWWWPDEFGYSCELNMDHWDDGEFFCAYGERKNK